MGKRRSPLGSDGSTSTPSGCVARFSASRPRAPGRASGPGTPGDGVENAVVLGELDAVARRQRVPERLLVPLSASVLAADHDDAGAVARDRRARRAARCRAAARARTGGTRSRDSSRRGRRGSTSGSKRGPWKPRSTERARTKYSPTEAQRRQRTRRHASAALMPKSGSVGLASGSITSSSGPIVRPSRLRRQAPARPLRDVLAHVEVVVVVGATSRRGATDQDRLFAVVGVVEVDGHVGGAVVDEVVGAGDALQRPPLACPARA